MANLWHVFLFSLVGGALSLVGGMLLFINKRSANRLASYATPFAAGVLLGAAFFELLPEALEEAEPLTVFSWTIIGLLSFFVLERFMHWFHHHQDSDKHPAQERPTGPLIIIGDTVHNSLDGVAIGAAFLVNIPTGIITSLAVAAHEVPQEVGDFGLLLKLGYGRAKVLLINILSAFSTTPVALLVFTLGGGEHFPLAELLGLTAGFFIYIAASDLIPRMHKTAKPSLAAIESALMIGGVVLIMFATSLAHSYIEANHESISEPSHDTQIEPPHPE